MKREEDIEKVLQNSSHGKPKDIYDYYVHGLVDTTYINGETLKELQEFPLKVQGIIQGYKEVFAKGTIFDKEQKLLVPSITVAQLG
nr:hypothetical protein [Tanacetum cinerariifolium]